MRSSSLSTIVCLAVAVIASPTPLDFSSLEARDDWTSPARRDVFRKRTPEPEPQPEIDAWTPPVRRDVFLKRTPEPEPQPESVAWMSPARRDVFLKRTPQPETVVDKRAPFILTRNSIPSSDSIDITPSVNSANSRLPFFFKRDGKLQSRDIEALEARKAELEQREAEEFARLETEELSRREAEDLVLREVEELVRREAEKLEAREASALRKRAAFEDIEARELELESAKREYEEMFRREYEAEESRDLESREPLSFTLPRNMVVSGRRLPFDLTVSLDARDFDDEVVQFAKREPQFNIASLISQLSGNSTAGAGGSTNSNSAASRLSALTNGRLGNNAGVSALTSALSRFGFNFRREEESVDDRDFDDAVAYLSKRDPQFNIASLISQLSGNTTAGAGGSTNTNSAASRLSALTNGRLGNLGTTGGASGLTSALSRLGFNFRREEESAAAREPFDFDSFVNVRRQELSN